MTTKGRKLADRLTVSAGIDAYHRHIHVPYRLGNRDCALWLSPKHAGTYITSPLHDTDPVLAVKAIRVRDGVDPAPVARMLAIEHENVLSTLSIAPGTYKHVHELVDQIIVMLYHQHHREMLDTDNMVRLFSLLQDLVQPGVGKFNNVVRNYVTVYQRPRFIAQDYVEYALMKYAAWHAMDKYRRSSFVKHVAKVLFADDVETVDCFHIPVVAVEASIVEYAYEILRTRWWETKLYKGDCYE